MFCRSTRSFYRISLGIVALTCSLLALNTSAQVLGQALDLPAEDIIAPRVNHQVADRGTNPNGTYFFNASVYDNAAVQSVTLFYRTIGDKQYIALPMNHQGGEQYAALLAPEAVKAPGIEYYIQAKDSSGNAVLVGAAFSPLQLSVSTPVETATQSAQLATGGAVITGNLGETEEKPEPESSSKKWWWIAAGVVVAGVIAANSGGGGSDDQPSTPVPTTGTLTVSAPLPQ